MNHILSLGAGVQSSTMALMAAKGEITPMPTAAVFSDTQAEPGYKTRNNPKGEREGIYGWLDWLEGELPFPVYTVTAGDLTKNSLQMKTREKDGKWGKKGEKYMKKIIPLFGQMPSGEVVAALGRNCTEDYKIRPIIRKTKEIAGWKGRKPKEPIVTTWIGISKDEIQRMRESREPWIEHRWPLVEMDMHRHHCIEWMRDNGYPEPPRSACYYCPFHSDHEWRKLRDSDPEHFADAIEFDKQVRELSKKDQALKMTAYLHRSCKPLDEIDFDSDEDKGQLTWDFKAECSGLCGV